MSTLAVQASIAYPWWWFYVDGLTLLVACGWWLVVWAGSRDFHW